MSVSFKRVGVLVLVVFVIISGVLSAEGNSKKKVFFGAQASFSLLLENEGINNIGFITSATSLGAFAEWKFIKNLSLGLYGFRNHFSPGGTEFNHYFVNRDGVANVFNFHLGLGINLPLISAVEVFGLAGFGIKTGTMKSPSLRINGQTQEGAETEVSGNYWVGEFGMRIFFTAKKVTYKFYWSYKIDNLFADYIYSDVFGAINVGIIVTI